MKSLLASPRFWPRAAVWGGAIASTAMNLSSNWHAETVDGITTFIAPTAGGLHLPEVTKLVVSAAFPLLLIFAVESAARTSLRFSWRDPGSYAMPVGAITVFLFSVGEVTRLLLGMGQPAPLALLFALAPDLLITAGTVVLMRERALPVASVTAQQEAPTPSPVREDSCKQDAPAPAPAAPAAVAAAAPASQSQREASAKKTTPAIAREVRTDVVDTPARQEVDERRDTLPEPREAEGSRPANVSISNAEALARVRQYREDNNGQLPSANWMKLNLGMGARRAARLLQNVNRPDSEIVELRTVSSATG